MTNNSSPQPKLTPVTVENPWRDQINAVVREQLAQNRILRVRVITTSMSPLIRAGETIVVEPADAKSFALGDIVLFRQSEVWLVHRIVAHTLEGGWLTKGDRAPSCDKMQGSEWIGRVVAIENATRRFNFGRASRLARLIAFLSLGAARAEEKKRRWQARIERVLVRLLTFIARAELERGRG